MSVVTFMLIGFALVLFVPVIVFFVEVMAAIILKRPKVHEQNTPLAFPRVAVLIPAHNESVGLIPTLEDVRAQLRPGDRLLVVADNCSDDTATVARSMGAEVVERRDPERIGKGYALDWGIDHLQSDHPAILVVIDADCRLGKHCIHTLARACANTQRPVQSLYLMENSTGHNPQQRVAQFAWILKTYVRPMGLAKLGLPCQLMGTGMAFPWEAITEAIIGGSLVEDLKLGLALAAARKAPVFCPCARVSSTFPTSQFGRLKQQQRWEIGSLHAVVTEAPAYIAKAISQLNRSLLALALDALIPPLAVLAVTLLAFLAIALWAAIVSSNLWPLIIVVGNSTLFAATIVLAWSCYGRTTLRKRDVGDVFWYLLAKLHIYRSPRGMRWTRTDRQ